MSYLRQGTKMGTWCRRRLQKKTRGHSESGKNKGLIPPSWARFCARAGKGYKHPSYSLWSAICNGDKVKWKKT